MAYDPAEWTEIVTVESVTEEVMQLARDIESGWYSDATRIDWEDFWSRLEGTHLQDGTRIDLGSETGSPAMKKIQATINKERRYA